MTPLAKIHSIVAIAPGWYSDPSFLRAAHEDPALWTDYALDAAQRGAKLDAAAHTRRVLAAVLPGIAALFAADATEGDCLKRALLLQRLLEEAGVWCWVTQGGMTAEFPEEWCIAPIGFRPLSLTVPLGHCWLVAPPFRVVDLSLKHQPDSARGARRLPAVLAVEQVEPLPLSILDVADRQLIEQVGAAADLPPALREFNRDFPACRFLQDRVRFRYTPTAIAIPAPPLDDWQQKIAGVTPREIFRTLVAPAL
ncbi:hypothetical protein [Roseiterribacter gracilis]|uniref:Uncharacterized protein n=1 Tax=Roseiterribacter gracilis TaxID=2812848 RepID=A0A8S8XH05_9PROT|nr:hypothetical protein TMPK1_26670 [Rhodospirillales bacterium TMPK1]